MKKTEAHYRQIKKQYPKTMSKDQLYRIANISKATALYLLQSGTISCEDTGKKTRRYTIKTDDMIEYLKQRAVHPEKYKASEGWYSKTAGNKKTNEPRTSYRITLIAEQTRKFEQFFETGMKDMADLLTTNDHSLFSGFKSTAIITWCNRKKLKSFKIGGRFLILKECAIKHLVSPTMLNSSYKSSKYKLFITEFRKQYNINT